MTPPTRTSPTFHGSTVMRAARVTAIAGVAAGLALAPAATASAAPWDQAAPAPVAASHGAVADIALSKVGAPYVYGAAGPDAFDCSGFVQWAHAQAGISIPRTSGDQWGAGAPVGLDALQPGDVVVMYGGGHVAIYVGNGQVVHALNSGTPVLVDSMSSYPVDGAVRF